MSKLVLICHTTGCGYKASIPVGPFAYDHVHWGHLYIAGGRKALADHTTGCEMVQDGEDVPPEATLEVCELGRAIQIAWCEGIKAYKIRLREFIK